MRMDRLTTKAQEALRAAIDLAMRRGNPELIPEHLLVAILEQDRGVGAALAARAGADPKALIADLSQRIDALPRVSGGAEPGFGRRALPLLNRAEEEASSRTTTSPSNTSCSLQPRPTRTCRRSSTDTP
jgi:ATP-dependent Clp protease ATP-binding subunit ClpB